MPQSTVEQIHQRFGSEFCVCPFLGAFYQSHRVVGHVSKDTSTIVPCSVFDWDGRSDTHDVINDSILDSVNTPVWRKVRQQFTEGDYWNISQCRTCHDAERMGGNAPRIGALKHYVQHYHGDIIADIEQIIAQDYKTHKIVSLDWYPSNYCNFSCVMCAGGASSSRMTYEIKITRVDQEIVINSVTDDFFSVLRDVEIINFTGGETAMQPQVRDMIQYLVNNNMAKNKTVFLLTNASNFDDQMEKMLSAFHCVVFMCSIDGVGSVIEYQRRGADWLTVERNSLRILKHPHIRSVINIVVTAVNAPGLADFVDWLYANDVVNGVSVSPVFRAEHLMLSAMPPELRDKILTRLLQQHADYMALDTEVSQNCVRVLDALISVIRNSDAFDQSVFKRFRAKIRLEDHHSQTPLALAVPDWAPYL